jgi:hypothetical protein
LPVVILCLTATPVSSAQDKVNLVWKFEKGKPFRQTVATESDQSIKVMGQVVSQKQSQTFFFSCTPKEHADNGDWVVAQKVDGLKISIDANNQPLVFDSTNPALNNAALAGQFKKFVGAENKITLNNEMKVIKFDGQKMAAGNLLNDDLLKQIAIPAFGLIPNKEVTKGESWKNVNRLQFGAIGGCDNTYTYVFDGRDPGDSNIAIIKVKQTLKYSKPAGGGLPFVVKNGVVNVKKGEGTIRFDIARARVVDFASTLELEGTLDIAIGDTPTKVELKQSVSTRYSSN